MKDKREKINLGSGKAIRNPEVWINHDICYHDPEIDVAWDLNCFPYPWDDNRFQAVRAWDVLEHLDDPLKVINEIWRILKPAGTFWFRVPTPESKSLWRDLTHKRPFEPESFDYLDPDTKLGERFPFYSDRKWRITHKEIDELKALKIAMKTRK